MRFIKGTILDLKKQFEARGTEHGSKQYPQIDAEVDSNESELYLEGQSIATRLEEDHEPVVASYRKQITNCKDQWNTLGTDGNIQLEVTQEIENLNIKIESLYHKFKDDLITAKAKIYTSLGVIKKFKIDHNLNREAEYPVSHLRALSITLSIVLLETVFNSYSHQGEGGLLEGGFIAFFISFTNVFLGLVLGRCFSYRNHLNSTKNYLGWASLVTFFILAVYMNSLYATFRFLFHNLLAVSQNELESAKASGDAFAMALGNAWHIFILDIPFKDLISYITFLVTLGFSCYAFYEGYKWDDPCPGYGKLDREFKKLKESYDLIEDQFHKEIDSYCGQVTNSYDQKIDNLLRISPKVLLDLANEIDVKKETLQADIDLLNNEINSVVSAYRHANKATRGDGKVPDIFKKSNTNIEIQRIGQKYNDIIQEIKVHNDLIKDQYSNLFRDLRFKKEDLSLKAESKMHSSKSEYKVQIEKQASIGATQTAKV